MSRKSLSIIISITLAAILCWLAFAPTGIASDVQVECKSQAVGAPITLSITVNSLFPSITPGATSSLPPSLVLAHDAHTSFAGFSATGPLWKHRFTLFIADLEPVPETTLLVNGFTVKLPELNPELPTDLPPKPMLDAAAPAPVQSNLPWFLLSLCLLFAFGLWKAYQARKQALNPLAQLQHLPPTPESLDKLTDLLDSATLPDDFKKRLDDARFGKCPPDPQQIQDLLNQARHLLKQHQS